MVQHSAQAPSIGVDKGLFELPGKEPLWIWVHTCPHKNCDCRNAFIIAGESRDALLTRGLPVHEAWQAGVGYATVVDQLEELTPFFMDIDTLEVADPSGKTLIPLEAPQRITAIIDRMDSDILDAIAMLWYTGKGHPDQRDMVFGAPSISVSDWRVGGMLPYCEVFKWVRSDIYFLDDEAKTAFNIQDMYCITPGCECGDMVVLFQQLSQYEPQTVGIAEVNLSGATVLKPEPGQEETLNLLWSAFRKRHPAYLARFAQHDADMKSIGKKVNVPTRPKVGRNEPCPCGSGKKYKKCCWA